MLYFDKLIIIRYKREISIIESYYNRTIEQFSNIEKEANESADSFYKNYPLCEDIDPANVAEMAQEQGLEMYETLNSMKSYHLQMTIAMLYSIWEKQIIKFTLEELNHYPGTKINGKEIEKINSFLFRQVREIFKCHGIIFENLNCWNNLKELKLLTNVIKHGEGDSAGGLSKIRPDLFDFGISNNSDLSNIFNADKLNIIKRSNRYILLNKLQESDLCNYIKAVNNFWDEMPSGKVELVTT
jgi:hypothetical protein